MSQGLPAPYVANNNGTNVYGTVDTGGAAAKQVLMLKQLTGGRNIKKGGAPQTIEGGKIIVPPFPNGGTAANQINLKLAQIAGQAQANGAYDNPKGGGKIRKYKNKTKRSHKKRRGQKKTKTRRRRR
jgi:hypothetical protein